MDFKDTVLQLAERIAKQKDAIATEEGTKNAFIMPMLIALGYDVFNPEEVVPEMDCDLVKKKGEKIDYAIMKDSQPILLVECKHCGQNLNLHDTQLQKYFVASKSRFGVLTNGVEYRFYTDLEKANIMDEKPFLVVNMLDLSDSDIEQLKKFHKSYYNESEILSTAQELQITLQVKNLFNYNIQAPTADFVRYFVKELNDGKYTSKQVEQYTPIVKKSFASVINDIIADRLNVVIKSEEQSQEIMPAVKELTHTESEPMPDGIVFVDKETGIVTTQEEIDAYNIIRSILRKDVDVSKITYKDTKSYFVVNFENSPSYWVCRISLKQYSKRICFPKDNYKSNEWFDIESLDDIFQYADRLVESLKMAMRE